MLNKLVDIKTATESMKISRAKLLQLVNAGDFPPPVRVNGKLVWSESEIDLMVKSMLSGMSEKGIKKTIQEILNRRQYYREIYDVK